MMEKSKKSETGGGVNVIYKCDSSLEQLDVYDKDNLIAWNSEE